MKGKIKGKRAIFFFSSLSRWRERELKPIMNNASSLISTFEFLFFFFFFPFFLFHFLIIQKPAQFHSIYNIDFVLDKRHKSRQDGVIEGPSHSS